ncbi:MAG: DUF2007 domain-containing protein [Chloroflexi bacterium]|nr:DUF2007 domain-containing protein [Chloroflexota bacterium]
MPSSGKHELVLVYTSSGPLAAEVVKAKLETAGIPVLLQSEAQSVFSVTIDGMGAVKVLVPKEHEEAARQLLKTEGREPKADSPGGEGLG